MRTSDIFLCLENPASKRGSRHNDGRVYNGPAGTGQDHD